jgi:DNA-binding response OmpR family regulator
MKHSLLMIDDNQEDIRQVRAFLDLHIYSLDSCTDPLEGVNLARQYPADLIILDIQMQPLDGFGVIRRLQRNPETRDIPIVIFSIVGDEDEIILRGLGLGAEHIVYKGRKHSLQILEATIEKQLRTDRPSSMQLFNAREHQLKVSGDAERVWVDNREVQLTRCQRLILLRLIEAEGKFISTDELLTLIGKDCRGDEYIIATQSYAYKFIYDLRNRLEPDAGNPVFIESQRDLGYRLKQWA